MTEELKKIKKMYGEKMAHMCRELFSTILEKEGLLIKILQDHFYENKELYNDIEEQGKKEEFQNYIYSFVNVENNMLIDTNKNPKELLNEAGYDFFECRSEADIKFFERYYAQGERLCTFDGGRLKKCYVFFAVKKDVDSIRREDFKNPERQDLYGTSVISIQFSRSKNTVSIKNRYNHRVANPDATFSNNLEMIINGLTKSFEKEYGLSIISNYTAFELGGYVLANDGKNYKVNFEQDNINYCANNIIIDNFKVKKYEPSRYLILDNFILDLEKKEIKLYKDGKEDGFLKGLKDIDKIEIFKKENVKEIKISFKDNLKKEVVIKVDIFGNIIGYNNSNLTTIGDNFLYCNRALIELIVPNITIIGDNFLYRNRALIELSAPNITTIGDNFLYRNRALTELNMPGLTTVGNGFLSMQETITKLNVPNLTTVGDNFLSNNNTITELNVPNLITVGNNFLRHNDNTITELIVPNLITVGDNFFYYNDIITELNVPNLITVGHEFLHYNLTLRDKILESINEKGNRSK